MSTRTAWNRLSNCLKPRSKKHRLCLRENAASLDTKVVLLSVRRFSANDSTTSSTVTQISSAVGRPSEGEQRKSKSFSLWVREKLQTKWNKPFRYFEKNVASSVDAEVASPCLSADESSTATQIESSYVSNLKKFEHVCDKVEKNYSDRSTIDYFPNCKQQLTAVNSFSDLKNATGDSIDVYFYPYVKDVPFPLGFTEVEFPTDSPYYEAVQHMRDLHFEVHTGMLTDTPRISFIVLFETESLKTKYSRKSNPMQETQLPEDDLPIPISDTDAFNIAVEQFCEFFAYECGNWL